MVTRRGFLASALVRRPRRPNVVMFMTDDHGAWALGAYGCPSILTPNIDALASGGARFTRAFACTPVCSPSRMTYMTGLLPSGHGVQDWLVPEDSYGPAARRFLDGHTAYSEILARSGYALGMCGKWHMGEDDKAQRGFTYWHTVPGGGGTYRDPEFITNGHSRKLSGFKTDLVADGALEFLDGVDRDRPFYLLVPFYAPHRPFDYQPERYRDPYRDSQFPCFPDSPVHPWQNATLRDVHGKRENKLAYSALITGVDHNVGRIVKRIDGMGVRENTVIVFTADQGWNAGHHGVWGKGNGTVPFNMYEESLRVPMIWNHPGRIQAGLTVDAMVSSYDWLHSILDYTGCRRHRSVGMPGRSYAPLVAGEHPRWRNRLLFEYAYVRCLRTENMKYVERTDGWPSELFDLEADPGEMRNVIGDPAYARVLGGLRDELAVSFRSLGAPEIAKWQTTTTQRLPKYQPATPR